MNATHTSDAAIRDDSFFGHPRGLSTLFFTEMWERFSYYGMRALLILFMTTAIDQGGLGFDTARAGAIYGLYTAGVYLLALPGGFLADRLLGQQKAVIHGGLLIAAGHFSLAVGGLGFFYLGLVLIVLGTGLLKPNISTIVGDLYSSDDDRRDAGFSIFYMGINLGGFAAPIICGYLGEQVDWHLGFGVAGVGMLFGLAQYVLGRPRLGSAGLHPKAPVDAATARRIYGVLGMSLAAGALFAFAMYSGILPWNVVQLASAGTGFIFALAVLFFAYMLLAAGLEPQEKRRVGSVAVFFLFSAIFWCGFEQGGSSMSIFARDMTDRMIGGWEFPASWFQFVNSAYVILFVPIFAALWLRLGSRQPSVPVKFAIGLVLLGAGFAVLTRAAQLAAAGERVGLGWLVVVYLLHTCGELCISPVGLSTVTKLSPDRFVSQMMGIWFLSIALGNLTAGLVAGRIESLSMTEVFGGVAAACVVAGVVMAMVSRPVRRWMT